VAGLTAGGLIAMATMTKRHDGQGMGDATQFQQVSDSPPMPHVAGLVLRASSSGEWLHGAYLLSVYEPGPDLVLEGRLDDSDRVFVATPLRGDPMIPRELPPLPLPLPPPGELAGGYFNIEVRQWFHERGATARLPRSGRLTVRVRWRDLVSEPLTISL
jgi:hypothetical protein